MLGRVRNLVRGKGHHELSYWQRRAQAEGRLRNDHFEELFTTMFQLDESFYDGKRVLDSGCGPRGSLESADNAAERVGIDPLADKYRQLGTDAHEMEYVRAGVEAIPFPDGYFDVVTSLNSLDHVDDLDTAIREIARVTRSTFLLEVEIGHEPTPTEPISLWVDVLARFEPWFRVAWHRVFEMPAEHKVHDAGRGNSYDVTSGVRPAVLVAPLDRR